MSSAVERGALGAVVTTVPDHSVVLHDLTIAFDRQPAVHHVAGSFDPGSLTAIIGPNGAGKSTLLKAMVGILRPAEGRVEVTSDGPIAYLPQQADVDRSFPISVLDTVLLGLWRRIGWARAVTPALLDEAHEAIAAVGLAGSERHAVGTLSVGQFQRVLFARILLQNAPVILLDEPFAAVDEATTADLIEIVERWHAERRTVIAVLHDLQQVRAHFPSTLLLACTCIAWGPTDTVLTPQNLGRVRRRLDPWIEQALALQAAP
jgi:zinc/manganese transport system ATP-binding protein